MYHLQNFHCCFVFFFNSHLLCFWFFWSVKSLSRPVNSYFSTPTISVASQRWVVVTVFVQCWIKSRKEIRIFEELWCCVDEGSQNGDKTINSRRRTGWSFQVWKVKPMQNCPNPGVCLTVGRGNCIDCKKKSYCIESNTKMTLQLTRCVTLVNKFIILITSFKSFSMHYDVHFIMMVLLKVK